jgi:hypothetical protein
MKIILTVYDIHLLLSELNHLMRFTNRNNQTPEYLFNKITKQLNDKNITIEDEKSNEPRK